MNAFDVFCDGFQAYCDERSATTVADHDACAEAWHKMSAEEQAVYEEKAKASDYRAFYYFVHVAKERNLGLTFSQLAAKWCSSGVAWRLNWEIQALEAQSCV